ncbi:MAG: DUF3352 domain-containing protein [Candidatus Aminicenantia bacterium]
MKKKKIILFVLVLTLILSFSCKKPTVPKAGKAGVDDMLNFLPRQAQGIIFLNVQKVATTKLFDKATTEESEKAENYQKFIKEWGIDPKKDVYFLAVAITGKLDPKEKPDAVVVANLKYNKDLILANLKEEELNIEEEDYQGITIYSGIDEKNEKTKMAFLNESNIALGADTPLKAVIDLSRGKGENIRKNEQLMALLKDVNQEAFLWGGFLVPKKAMEEAAAKNPQAKIFESIEAATFFVDYDKLNYSGQVSLMSKNEAQNKQIADLLNGFKAMFGMGKSQDEDIQELLNSINISSGPSGVKVAVQLSENLLTRLEEKSKKEKEAE